MWSTWLNGSSLPALEQTISFAQQRHQLLASNLANADTPDYKTRDISTNEFQSQLKAALTQPKSSSQPYSSQPYTPANANAGFEKVRDVSKQIVYHDGHDVSLEEQVTEIAKNQSMHNTAIALMRSQLQTLRAAISESANI